VRAEAGERFIHHAHLSANRLSNGSIFPRRSRIISQAASFPPIQVHSLVLLELCVSGLCRAKICCSLPPSRHLMEASGLSQARSSMLFASHPIFLLGNHLPRRVFPLSLTPPLLKGAAATAGRRGLLPISCLRRALSRRPPSCRPCPARSPHRRAAHHLGRHHALQTTFTSSASTKATPPKNAGGLPLRPRL